LGEQDLEVAPRCSTGNTKGDSTALYVGQGHQLGARLLEPEAGQVGALHQVYLGRQVQEASGQVAYFVPQGDFSGEPLRQVLFWNVDSPEEEPDALWRLVSDQQQVPHPGKRRL